MKTLVALAVLLAGLAPASAQEGPSFDCGQAGTRTEQAICGSPWLARLEREAVAAYETLAETVGRREARAVADRRLARRQACEGDRGCIQDELIASTRAFESRTRAATRSDRGARSADGRDRAARAAAPGEGPRVLTEVPRPVARPDPGPPGAAPGSDLLAIEDPTPPLAAEAPAPDAAEDPADPTPAFLPVAREAAVPEPVVAPEPDPGAGPISALTDAFLTLQPAQRADLQGRLAKAGYGDLTPDGEWTLATATALASLLLDVSVGDPGLDPTTPDGAAALLDFIDSDRFKREFLGED